MRDDIAATKRRSLKSRMNGVYTTYIGFKLFEYPWYMYIYVMEDFFKHLVKGIIPEKLYIMMHRKKVDGGV